MRSFLETPDALPLRQRKKLQTRQQIVDAAALLFSKKGFESVTVADIAREAEVSDQTVFNYFATKEALVFDEGEAFEARFVSMIRDRQAAQTPLDAVRTEALRFLDDLSRRTASTPRRGGMPYLVVTSSIVRRHWLALLDRYANSVARALVDEGAGEPSLAVSKVLAISMLAVFAVIIEELGEAIRSGENHAELIARLRPQIEDALGHLSRGFHFFSRSQPR